MRRSVSGEMVAKFGPFVALQIEELPGSYRGDTHLPFGVTGRSYRGHPTALQLPPFAPSPTKISQPPHFGPAARTNSAVPNSLTIPAERGIVAFL